ncbi:MULTISPECIES: phage tail protein [Aequorivita]|uniref:Tail fiber protein n=2 Tax=Aequorivita TaxID=153265 RepID=A0AB35YUU1_9FLAO|nr:tail fiber protein [Aequorivita sp. Ant34-E75]WGF93376.1 tail fiber protein [Aequorivita sp. Ant34-E75]
MEPFLGQIQAFGFNFAPRGWAHCNGQLLAISQNTALFSLLGTIYGGDGRTTFALPDLRGRAGLHFGQGPGLSDIRIGERGGVENHTLTTAQMPSHNHTVAPGGKEEGNSDNPDGRYVAGDGTSSFGDTSDISLGASPSTFTGGGQSFGVRDPFLGINFCIALQGIYPSRS